MTDAKSPNQLRHTLATQAINWDKSLEAIAALLGHRSMRMTMTCARFSNRTASNEQFRVTEASRPTMDEPRHCPTTSPAPTCTNSRPAAGQVVKCAGPVCPQLINATPD